jgi:uncharacterized membrane protein
MTTSSIVIVNLILAVLVVAAVGGLVWIAHRLPTHAPEHDARWGRGGNPWVASDPLPLAQVARHETERELSRAA